MSTQHKAPLLAFLVVAALCLVVVAAFDPQAVPSPVASLVNHVLPGHHLAPRSTTEDSVLSGQELAPALPAPHHAHHAGARRAGHPRHAKAAGKSTRAPHSGRGHRSRPKRTVKPRPELASHQSAATPSAPTYPSYGSTTTPGTSKSPISHVPSYGSWGSYPGRSGSAPGHTGSHGYGYGSYGVPGQSTVSHGAYGSVSQGPLGAPTVVATTAPYGADPISTGAMASHGNGHAYGTMKKTSGYGPQATYQWHGATQHRKGHHRHGRHGKGHARRHAHGRRNAR